MVKIIALARPLADSGEHRHAAVRFGDVVDQLLNDHSLAHAGAAEQPDLAAFQDRTKKVDDFNAGFQDLGFGRLLDKLRGGPVDRIFFF